MIAVRELWAGYGKEPVLRGIEFAAARGEFVGILGPNACGKSTLLRVLTGALPFDRGEVLVDELDAAHAEPRRLAQAHGPGAMRTLHGVSCLV